MRPDGSRRSARRRWPRGAPHEVARRRPPAAARPAWAIARRESVLYGRWPRPSRPRRRYRLPRLDLGEVRTRLPRACVARRGALPPRPDDLGMLRKQRLAPYQPRRDGLRRRRAHCGDDVALPEGARPPPRPATSRTAASRPGSARTATSSCTAAPATSRTPSAARRTALRSRRASTGSRRSRGSTSSHSTSRLRGSLIFGEERYGLAWDPERGRRRWQLADE